SRDIGKRVTVTVTKLEGPRAEVQARRLPQIRRHRFLSIKRCRYELNMQAQIRRNFLSAVTILSLLLLPRGTYAKELPHYVFVLPDGYVGWIHVVFSSDDAPVLPFKNNTFILNIDN